MEKVATFEDFVYLCLHRELSPPDVCIGGYVDLPGLKQGHGYDWR